MGAVAGLGGVGGLGGLGLPRPLGSRLTPLALVRPSDPAPDHRARASCRASASAPRSGWPFTSCGCPRRTRSRSPTRSARSRSTVGLCEICFNLADGPRCRICEDERRDASRDLRRRGGRRRDPGRAHARVPRPLPRARRRALADRRRGPRGPQASRSCYGRVHGERRCARWCSPRTRPRPARRPRCTWPTRCASARRRSRSRGCAAGLPVGADLEYADEVTLGKAFRGRREL